MLHPSDPSPPLRAPAAEGRGGADDPPAVREAVAVIDTLDALEDAVETLEDHGFDHADISLLADRDTVREKMGNAYREVTEVEDTAEAPRTAFVSGADVREGQTAAVGVPAFLGAAAATTTLVASGGTPLAILGAAIAAGAGGGAVGAALARWLGRAHGERMEQQLRRGGIVVWVRTPTRERERAALEILGRHSRDEPYIHELPAG